MSDSFLRQMCKDEKNNSWLGVANVEWHLIDRLFSIEATFHSGNAFIIESGKLEEKLQKKIKQSVQSNI